MKIDTNTINILKNFAKINPSIVIPEGNVLKTISPSKTIMARATIDSTFEKRFAVYNLDSFIANLSMFNDPDITFGTSNISIREGSYKQNIPYADESAVTKLPANDVVLPSVDATFTLTQEHFKRLERAAGINSLPELMVIGDGSKLYLQVDDSKTPNGNLMSIEVGDSNKVFKAIFRLDNIRILPGDYEVNICSRGISHFSGNGVEYWIAVEQNSTF
jgi:hypothetical protein